MTQRRAVFLDRDGTLMEEVGYCSRPEDVRVFAGVPEALRRLREAGFLLVLVTNQSGIARGYFGWREFEAVQAELTQQLGLALDAVYACPDLEGEDRKPGTGMVRRAERELGIDLGGSYFVGDKAADVLCGQAAGTRTVLVETGYGRQQSNVTPDFVAPDLAAAAEWILKS